METDPEPRDRRGPGEPAPAAGGDRTEGARAALARTLAPLAAAALLAAGAAAACTEEPLTGPGPEEGEDPPAQTVELALRPGDMPAWRDTTFTGFALPSDAGFFVLADRDALSSRMLVRFAGFPDSVAVDDDTLAVESYENGRLALLLDTARTTAPSGGMTIRLSTLARNFDEEEATWQLAADGQPWNSAGGDFDQEVGRLELAQVSDSALADTLLVPLDVSTDSLVRAWRGDGGRPGVGVVLEAPGGRLQVNGAGLLFDVRPAGRDTLVGSLVSAFSAAGASTFIFDPPTPPPGQALRVGGLPASRLYLTFRPPESAGDVRIAGSTVNRAEILFRPGPAPPAPFSLEGTATAAGIELAADPFELGPKVPIGDTLATGTRTLLGDSLAAGNPVRFDVTGLVRRWASSPDSAGELRLAVRLRPDDQTLGFWGFGSESSAPALQPVVRILLTPPGGFDLP